MYVRTCVFKLHCAVQLLFTVLVTRDSGRRESVHIRSKNGQPTYKPLTALHHDRNLVLHGWDRRQETGEDDSDTEVPTHRVDRRKKKTKRGLQKKGT